MERGYPIVRYVQDRTVIEDTESSVDLAVRGWTLYNHPERLAYSATPPDFGSLVIQRRRWANGGLIILPKLVRYWLAAPLRRLPEMTFRFHYLASIAAVNIGLVIMLSLPLGNRVESLWLPFTALPYFVLFTRDLYLCGYRLVDMLRVYALNLLLIPVNIGGVLKSIQQGVSGKKIPFGRTPKVSGRTAAPALYVLAGWLMLAHWVVGASGDFVDGNFNHAVFAVVNAMFLAYALVAFIGVRESVEDVRLAFRRTPKIKPVEALPTTVAANQDAANEIERPARVRA